MRYLLILLTFTILVSCNSFFKIPVMSVGAEAVGDMPEAARNVDTYKLRFMKTIDTTVVPRETFSNATDTLTFTFNYSEPDDLPI